MWWGEKEAQTGASRVQASRLLRGAPCAPAGRPVCQRFEFRSDRSDWPAPGSGPPAPAFARAEKQRGGAEQALWRSFLKRLPHNTPVNSPAMAPQKATKTAAEKKPAKKTTKTVAGDKKKKVKRSKARNFLASLRL